MSRETDGYTQRLQTFGYQEQGGFLGFPQGRLTLGLSRAFNRHLAAVMEFETLAGDTYQRSIENSTDTASFSAWGGWLGLRASTDVAGNWFGVYAQAGLGLSVGA